MKNDKGFSLLLVMAILGLVGSGSMYVMKNNFNVTKSNAKLENKFSTASLNSLIYSRLMYEDSCKSSLLDQLSDADKSGLIGNKRSEVKVNLNNGQVAKAGEIFKSYDTKINSLALEDFNEVAMKYGYKFYEGNLKIKNELEKSILTGNRNLPIVVLGKVAAMADPTGKIIACASSANALEDNSTYKNSQAQDPFPPDGPRTNLPTAADVPPPTPDCDYTCQMVRTFYRQNADWYRSYDSNFTVEAWADGWIKGSNREGRDVVRLAKAYGSVHGMFTPGTQGMQILDDFLKPMDITKSNYNDYTVTMETYSKAVNTGQTGTSSLIAHAVTEGYSATAIAQNVNQITAKYSQSDINAWFASGKTVNDAVKAGLIP